MSKTKIDGRKSMARAEEGIMQFEFKRVACLISAALSALFVVSLCPAAQAQIVVNSTGDEGPYPNKVYVCDVDPVTPGNQCTLRAAIETANGLAGTDTIQFQIPTSDPGYNPQTRSYTINLGNLLPNLSTDINITGPGASKLTVQRALGSFNFRIFNVTGSGTVNISKLTIARGQATGAVGGGVLNAGTGRVNISDCTFANNFGALGGAVGNYNASGPAGTVTITNCDLRNNAASGFGGAIENQGGTVTISRSKVRANFAVFASGGIDSTGSLTVTDTAVTDNRVITGTDPNAASGGGISSAGTMTLTRCTVSGNSARGHDGDTNQPSPSNAAGGGIYSLDTALNIINCTVSGNSAEGGNALDFAGNQAAGGGIVFTGTGNCKVSNSSIAGNSATGGYSPEGAGTGFGGGIYRDGGTVTVKNSIISNNSATTSGPDVYGTFISQGFNLIGKKDGSTGFNIATDLKGTVNAPLDPKLGLLQNNGGPAQTMALLPGSPAIDKGTSVSLAGTTLTADQRGTGFPRTIDNSSVANATGGDGTDIGAFELQ